MGNLSDRFLTLATSEYHVKLVKILHDQKIDFIFYMGHKLGTFFGVKDGDVYVIIESSTDAKIYSLKEFIDCCYNDLLLHIRRSRPEMSLQNDERLPLTEKSMSKHTTHGEE